ncbi:MAG TPA: CsgG/HfaB family protein [Gemmatimonadaceae bacterium]|nr:CsgG/HfaB family protein [Gemmatimonadaceae bacterium]
MLRSTLRSTLRSKPYATHIAMLLAAASFALPAVARAQDNRPVVVVFTFDNSSMGPGHADFEGIRTAVQDLLITDMASNTKIRLIDRARIAEVLQEQNMVQNGQIDPQTAVRLGKLFGAQYAVTGAFISDPHGKAILTAHTIDVETSQIANPNSVNGTTDDVLGMIAQLSSRLASNLNLAPKPGAARRTGDAGTGAKSEPAQSGAPASKAVETFAKPVAEEAMKIKLDPATVRVYSSAIDEADKKNKAKATDLFRQVLAKYPKFEPAQRQLDRLTH